MANDRPKKGTPGPGAPESFEKPRRPINTMDQSSTSENISGPATFFSWKSVFAGTAISLVSFILLSVLGLAIGATAFDATQATVVGYGWGSAIWMILSVVLALGAGGYAAARLSNYVTNRVGMAQGLTIGALFFAFAFWQGGAALGTVGGNLFGAVGTTLGGATGAAGNVASMAQQPFVQETVQRALDRANIQIDGDPQEVLQGVISRLLVGDTEAAQAYLAANSNIPVGQAEEQISAFIGTAQTEIAGAVNAVADTMAAIAWSVFVLMIVGLGAAMFGGAYGSKENFRHPLVEEERRPFAAAVPRPAHA